MWVFSLFIGPNQSDFGLDSVLTQTKPYPIGLDIFLPNGLLPLIRTKPNLKVLVRIGLDRFGNPKRPPLSKSPADLQSPEGDSTFALKDGALAKHFNTVNSNAVTLNLGSSGLVAYSLHKLNPLLPRLFAVIDHIFCLFQGRIENINILKQQYGLTKTATQVTIVMEAYRTLRDRGPYPADQVVRDFQGKFAFILYDVSTKNILLAADAEGSVPFFWGTDAEGHLVISDDVGTMKKGCGKSFAPFPKGCFFTSSGGLRSYEQPRNELKPVPRVDSSGQVCGATFKVDSESKKDSASMPRVGSVQCWSQQI